MEHAILTPHPIISLSSYLLWCLESEMCPQRLLLWTSGSQLVKLYLEGWRNSRRWGLGGRDGPASFQSLLCFKIHQDGRGHLRYLVSLQQTPTGLTVPSENHELPPFPWVVSVIYFMTRTGRINNSARPHTTPRTPVSPLSTLKGLLAFTSCSHSSDGQNLLWE